MDVSMKMGKRGTAMQVHQVVQPHHVVPALRAVDVGARARAYVGLVSTCVHGSCMRAVERPSSPLDLPCYTLSPPGRASLPSPSSDTPEAGARATRRAPAHGSMRSAYDDPPPI